jgi:hypothetical protein
MWVEDFDPLPLATSHVLDPWIDLRALKMPVKTVLFVEAPAFHLESEYVQS